MTNAKQMIMYFGQLVQDAIDTHLPEDRCLFDASITYLPSDEELGLIPVGVIYLQINGTEQTDGLYLTSTIAPSLITRDLVFELVEELAIKSADRRGEIRAALARGEAESTAGLPKPVEAG